MTTVMNIVSSPVNDPLLSCSISSHISFSSEAHTTQDALHMFVSVTFPPALLFMSIFLC